MKTYLAAMWMLLRDRKKYWLLPIVFVLLLWFGVVMAVAPLLTN